MARSKASRTRINMRIPADLVEWAKTYVGDHNTTVTQLFIDHLTKLRKREESNGNATVSRR